MKSYMNMLGVAALMARGSMIAYAPDGDAPILSVPNAAMVSDGQIALTAKNRGDGTWDVTAGPDGPVLHKGLPREKAIAIVGAPTGPYNPANEVEARDADLRVEAEQVLVDGAAKDVLKSDEEAGTADKALRNRSVVEPPPATLSSATLPAPEPEVPAPAAKTGASTSGAGADKGSKASEVGNGKGQNGEA